MALAESLRRNATRGAMTEIIRIETREAEQAIDIGSQVAEVVSRSGVDSGLCQVMVLHSTAAEVVNETADPNIGPDIVSALQGAVPTRNGWLHDLKDDNAHAHLKASLLGPSEILPIQEGAMLLGTWQGIWLLEFDGPRERRVAVHIIRAVA